MILHPPLSLTSLLLFQSASILLYTVESQPCVTHPLLHGQLHKNKGAYPQEFVGEGQSKSTPVCLFVFITFPFTVSSSSSLLTPCLLFLRTGPSVPDNAVNLTLFNPLGQLALRPLYRQECCSCQSAVQTPELLSPVSAFLCCLADIDLLRQDRNTCCCLYAAQCSLLSPLLPCLSSILYSCSYCHFSFFSIRQQ